MSGSHLEVSMIVIEGLQRSTSSSNRLRHCSVSVCKGSAPLGARSVPSDTLATAPFADPRCTLNMFR